MALLGPHGYKPLSKPNDIRLLDILPGAAEEPPSISLRAVNLSDDPDFEALSYVWGDVKKTKEILCNGHLVRVTANLHDALHQLRLPDRPRTLWADALCINQSDLDERSQQVRIMHLIYQSCRRCVIWLGLPDDEGDSDAALDLVQLLAELVCEKVDVPMEGLENHLKATGRELLQATEIGYSERLPPMDSPKWVSLFHFLCREWFTRIWVIQEAFFSSDLLFYCGARTCQYAALYYAADWVLTNGNPIGYATGFQSYEPERFNVMHMRQDSLLQQTQELSSLLGTFQKFRATDPRDKVYALMHLPAFRREYPGLGPDYRLPTAAVYIDVALHILRNSHGLRLLTMVDGGRGGGGGDEVVYLPSWVPRWHRPGSSNNVASSWYHLMGAGGKSERAKAAQSPRLLAPEGGVEDDDATVAALLSKTVLGIRGIEFDVIHDVCELEFWGRRVPNEPRIPLFRTRTGSWEPYRPRKANDDSASSSKQSASPAATVPETPKEEAPYATEPEVIAAYVMTLTASCREYKGIYPIRCAPSNYGHHAADFVAFLTWRQRQRPLGRSADPGGDFYPPGLYAADRPTLIDTDAGEVAAMSLRYSKMAHQYNMSRCLYRTRRGYLGTGPHDVQRGDVVCVLMGGAVPFILRPRGDGGGYIVIGDAYVHGIMDGELVQDWEEGKAELDIREFRIY
ncbi:HET-domain-containing protein [Apiospora kogelbergensis]|uniref:HET-domain-containing protein n=1 Tax=Apiospora kogelbergensis TaxID=1337665 RepID=UPI00312F4D05